MSADCQEASAPVRLTLPEQAELLHNHRAMVWEITHKLYARNRNSGVSLEDLHGHVQLGFVRAASKFDPSRGWKFSTYAYAAGWREGLLYVNAERTSGMHVPQHHPNIRITLGVVSAEFDAAQPDAGDGRDGRRDYGDDFWEVATRKLNPRERHVILRVYRDGKLLRELSDELGVTKQRVQQLHKRAMERVKRDSGKDLEIYLEAV